MTKEKTSKTNKIPPLEVLFPPRGESSTLLVACHAADFSASRMARAVEDADAAMLNLNVTSIDDGTPGSVTVHLRIDHRDPASAARSLERYGYRVVGVAAADDGDDRINDNYRQLMKYLEL